MDSSRELELKLSLDPSDVPALLAHPLLAAAAAGPVSVQQLQTVYFDDRDLSLAAEGISLRLRRAGDLQWQTVKLDDEETAAGLFSRRELEVEFEGERPELSAIPDEALRARIEAILDGRPIEPVYETVMQRTHLRMRDERAEWSLDLDEGAVRSGFASEPICELELELVSGPVSHLFEVALSLSEGIALRPGARSKAERGHALRTGIRPAAVRARPVVLEPDATLAQAIVSTARSCLAQIAENAVVALEGVDPEGVHQMRVGVRRLRALVALVRQVLPSIRLGRLRGPLRGLGAALGDVRDLDVFIERTLAVHRTLQGDEAGLEGLREGALQLREERRESLCAALLAPRTSRLLLELGHWIAATEEQGFAEGEPSVALGRRADHFAAGALTRLQRKAQKRASAAIEGSPADRHALRLTLKKLRYASEFFRTLFDPRDAKRFLRRVEKLLDLLGTQNDAETGRQILQQILDRTSFERAPELARSAGFVEGFGAREQAKASKKLARQWTRFESMEPFWTEN
ncbi:CYTH and CHAD domain-containing protein [Myxococcota bacterium]|nr:CYTH and CHAD domain-containing protein [Myxococcota bacterium]